MCVKKLTSNIDQGVPNNEFAKVIRLNNNNKIKNINMTNPINYNPIGMVKIKKFLYINTIFKFNSFIL